jgi:opacity protein-like surface antigen
MRYKLKIFLLCSLFPYSYILGQLQNQKSSLSLSVAGGMTYYVPQKYDFLQGGISSLITPGIFGSIGIVYEPIALNLIKPTQISLSMELSFSNTKSEEPSNSNDYSQTELQNITAMVWTRLSIPAPISPFVRAGIGISRIKFQENYGSSFYQNINLNDYSLALGIGAGVELSISEEFLLSIFGDALYTRRDLPVFHNDGTPWTTLKIYGVSILGLRATVKL